MLLSKLIHPYIGGGEGNSTLGAPCGSAPVFGTGDFSNSSTPPHARLGAPPRNRTAHAGFAIRPLATCCCGAWHPGGDSNTQWRVWNPLASPSATGAHGGCAHVVAPPEHWWAVKDSNLGDSNGIPGLQPGAFGLSANCPSELSKDLAEGRRLERLCPEGPWLSKPVGYQLPEPSGYKLQIGFRGKLQA